MLAKLHVASGKLPDLSALIDQPNSVVVPEIEPVLVDSRHIGVLCKLYQRHGDDEKLLRAWSKLADGQWQDPEVHDPLTRIFDLLSDRKDRASIQRWTAWLVKKDSERALKVRSLECDVAVWADHRAAVAIYSAFKTESRRRPIIAPANSRGKPNSG